MFLASSAFCPQHVPQSIQHDRLLYSIYYAFLSHYSQTELSLSEVFADQPPNSMQTFACSRDGNMDSILSILKEKSGWRMCPVVLSRDGLANAWSWTQICHRLTRRSVWLKDQSRDTSYSPRPAGAFSISRRLETSRRKWWEPAFTEYLTSATSN